MRHSCLQLKMLSVVKGIEVENHSKEDTNTKLLYFEYILSQNMYMYKGNTS